MGAVGSILILCSVLNKQHFNCGCPSLEAFKARLEEHPDLLGGNQHTAGGLELGDLQGPFQP